MSLILIVLVGSGIAISTIGVFAFKWWSERHRYRCLENLPSPQGRHWFFGHGRQILASVKEKKYFKLLFDWAKELGPIYVYWISNTPIIILSDPKLMENTLIDGVKQGAWVRTPSGQKAWNDAVGPILLGQNGTEWQWRRKAWNPEFTSSALSNHLDLVKQSCLQVIETIKQIPQTKTVKADPLFVELTMRVISGLLFGVPVDKNDSSPTNLPLLEIDRTYEAMSVITYRYLRIATGEKMWLKYLPIRASQEYWQARRYLEQFLAPRIDLALQIRDNSDRDWSEVSSLFKESMLVRIATKNTKYNRASLISESIQLLIAGTDTTAHSLSFALAELSLNRHIYEKAQNIVDRTWEKYNGINADSLRELNYISAIFKGVQSKTVAGMPMCLHIGIPTPAILDGIVW